VNGGLTRPQAFDDCWWEVFKVRPRTLPKKKRRRTKIDSLLTAPIDLVEHCLRGAAIDRQLFSSPRNSHLHQLKTSVGLIHPALLFITFTYSYRLFLPVWKGLKCRGGLLCNTCGKS